MPKIFRFLDRFKIIYDITDKILMTICKLLLIADILIATLTVLQRYLPNAIFPPIPCLRPSPRSGSVAFLGA